MNPVLFGVFMVATVIAIGIGQAVRGGLLKSSVEGPPFPPLDRQHPLVIDLSAELRSLDALPISSQEERETWDAARSKFEKKLRTEWSSIYDSLPHELEHYLTDVDIRAKDPDYARQQRSDLAMLLSQ